MFKTTRFLLKNTLANISIMALLVLGSCLIVWVSGSMNSFFATYVQTSSLVLAMIVFISAVGGTASLLNIALSMGATRRGMWGAVQLNLCIVTAISLAVQTVANTVENTLGSRGRFSINIQLNGSGILLFILIMMTMGNMGALIGVLRSNRGKIIAIVACVVGVAAAVLLMIFAKVVFSWACGAVLVGCAAASYVKLRNAQATTI